MMHIQEVSSLKGVDGMEYQEKIRDEWDNSHTEIDSLRGVFHKYADPDKRELEEAAWRDHVVKKYAKNNIREEMKRIFDRNSEVIFQDIDDPVDWQRENRDEWERDNLASN